MRIAPTSLRRPLLVVAGVLLAGCAPEHDDGAGAVVLSRAGVFDGTYEVRLVRLDSPGGGDDSDIDTQTWVFDGDDVSADVNGDGIVDDTGTTRTVGQVTVIEFGGGITYHARRTGDTGLTLGSSSLDTADDRLVLAALDGLAFAEEDALNDGASFLNKTIAISFIDRDGVVETVEFTTSAVNGTFDDEDADTGFDDGIFGNQGTFVFFRHDAGQITFVGESNQAATQILKGTWTNFGGTNGGTWTATITLVSSG